MALLLLLGWLLDVWDTGDLRLFKEINQEVSFSHLRAQPSALTAHFFCLVNGILAALATEFWDYVAYGLATSPA